MREDILKATLDVHRLWQRVYVQDPCHVDALELVRAHEQFAAPAPARRCNSLVLPSSRIAITAPRCDSHGVVQSVGNPSSRAIATASAALSAILFATCKSM